METGKPKKPVTLDVVPETMTFEGKRGCGGGFYGGSSQLPMRSTQTTA